MTNRELEVVGTARRPSASDLKKRGITGLIDPGPKVALRRAKLESQQAAARMRWTKNEMTLSHERVKIASRQRSSETTASDDVRSGLSERCDGKAEMDGEQDSSGENGDSVN